MKKMTKLALPLVALLCSHSSQASDSKELYDSLVAAGGSKAARDIAVRIATDFLPDSFKSSVHTIKVGEKLYAAKLFKKAALWMLAGVIDRDCKDSVTISSVSNDLEEIELNLEDLKRDPGRMDSFKDTLGKYWESLDDDLEREMSSLTIHSHESLKAEPDRVLAASHGAVVVSH